jgi:hypothetical protein
VSKHEFIFKHRRYEWISEDTYVELVSETSVGRITDCAVEL